jgi:hypothetical protein
MNADVETSQAFAAKWASTIALETAVPGGLHSDRLTTPAARPYARLTCKQARKPDNSTGGRYIDYREVEITLWGIGKAAVGGIASIIQGVFNDKALEFSAPNVFFMRCEPILAQIDQEETVKGGDDYRAASMRWIVWTDRKR